MHLRRRSDLRKWDVAIIDTNTIPIFVKGFIDGRFTVLPCGFPLAWLSLYHQTMTHRNFLFFCTMNGVLHYGTCTISIFNFADLTRNVALYLDLRVRADLHF